MSTWPFFQTTTNLLEKAKLEKKLAVLESERLAYHRNKGNAKGKLHEKDFRKLKKTKLS